jgi:hypothetical protein
MAKPSKRLLMKLQDSTLSTTSLPKSKTRETPTVMHSRYNSFLFSSITKQSPQPQPPPRRSSPYSHAIELSKSRSVSTLKLKELRKNATPERVLPTQLRKEISYKKLPEKQQGSRGTPVRPRKKGDIKLTSVYAENHSVPPSLNSSAALATGLSLSFNSSINTSIVGPLLKTPKGGLKRDKSRVRSEAMMLESQLTERLAAVQPTDAMSTDKFKVYQMIFEEVIHRDDRFGSLLTKIKQAYEDWHSAEDKQTMTERLRAELTDKTEELTRVKQEHSQLGKKVSKLSKENMELSRGLEDSEAKYQDLQERLLKLTQVKCDSVPRDETSWKYLVSENKYYAEVFKTLKQDTRQLKRREDKLLKLVYALKKQGFPVEQVYKEECRKTKLAKLPYKEVPGSSAGDEETEPLVQGPPKAVERPRGVPALSLADVEPDLSSESESGTEYTESEASSASELSRQSEKTVPKLVLSNGQERGFQEEFMSKLDEFSESWRRQIEKEGR